MTRDDALGRALLALARGAIGQKLGVSGEGPPDHQALDAPGATFVTLFGAAGLRGCIGSLQAQRPLRDDVRDNALKAAFSDPRFPPLAKGELAETSIEISLLSQSRVMHMASEAELRRLLRPGIDGVTLEHGPHRATFLPQVWTTLPDAAAFLAELKRKAGLDAGFWSPQLNVGLYEVTKWRESDFAPLRELL